MKLDSMMIKSWVKAFRLPFLTATAIPVVLGSVIAWNNSYAFNWLNFWIALAGVSFLHIGTNLANDYFDHKTSNDEVNFSFTPFSGGSRVIQDKLIHPFHVLSAAAVFFVAGSVLGIYLTWKLKSAVVVLLGVIGVFCGIFYTARPFKMGYRGIGETIVGVCFGPLVVLGAYYVQAKEISFLPLLASVPLGILIFLVLFINEFPDYEADKAVHKRTLVVNLGKYKASKVYHWLLFSVYLYTIFCIVGKMFPWQAGLVFFTLPIAFKAYKISKQNFDKIRELLPVNAMTILLHLLVGLLLSMGFILDKVF